MGSIRKNNWVFLLVLVFMLIAVSLSIVFSYSENNFFDKNEFVQTALPTMSIELSDENGKVYNLADVTRESYVNSTITISNTEEENLLDNATAQFKGRGNGSWNNAKKGFRLKFDKKVSLFGREKNKHWVLIACSNFDDDTMYRNYLAYNMVPTVFDNIEYTTNAKWIDVYINKEYQGVYLLCEHVRVGSGRVDIESEYNVLDTGYLIEYDAYAQGVEGVDYFCIDNVKYPFTVHSPDPEEYAEEGLSTEVYMQQVEFIKNYVESVYNAALTKDFETFETLVDVNSFVDMYILHEFFKNTDTGYSSFYLYKKPGGKLYAGPAWDFDGTTVAARGDSSPEGIYVAGDVQEKSNLTASELYISLYQTTEFKSLIVERWQEISNSVQSFIDSQMNKTVYEKIKPAMGRNYARWNKTSASRGEALWLKDVNVLKEWFDKRIRFLNTEWV